MKGKLKVTPAPTTHKAPTTQCLIAAAVDESNMYGKESVFQPLLADLSDRRARQSEK